MERFFPMHEGVRSDDEFGSAVEESAEPYWSVLPPVLPPVWESSLLESFLVSVYVPMGANDEVAWSSVEAGLGAESFEVLSVRRMNESRVEVLARVWRPVEDEGADVAVG